MRFLKGLLLFLAFFIDIHINAQGVFFPKNCWGVTIPCAIQNDSNHRLTLNLKGMSIHLDKDAIIAATGENEADLARGTLFAKHDGSFKWHTPFGDVLCEGCELLLQRHENDLEIDALKGNVSVLRKGDSEKYVLPPGFRVELSKVEADGKANLDFPQVSALRPLAKTWAKVYPGSIDDFKKDFKDYIESWKSALQVSSQMDLKETSRQIASFEEAKAKQLAAQRAREEERQKIRKLFFEKSLEE